MVARQGDAQPSDCSPRRAEVADTYQTRRAGVGEDVLQAQQDRVARTVGDDQRRSIEYHANPGVVAFGRAARETFGIGRDELIIARSAELERNHLNWMEGDNALRP